MTPLASVSLPAPFILSRRTCVVGTVGRDLVEPGSHPEVDGSHPTGHSTPGRDVSWSVL